MTEDLNMIEDLNTIEDLVMTEMCQEETDMIVIMIECRPERSGWRGCPTPSPTPFQETMDLLNSILRMISNLETEIRTGNREIKEESSTFKIFLTCSYCIV